jgi:cell division protein FtsB
MYTTRFGRLVKRINKKDPGDGGTGGGGGATLDPVELQKQLAEVTSSMAKIEAKRNELLNENKTIKDSLKNWEGLDPAHVRNLIDKINNDEELKLLTEGKHDEVVKRRTEKIEAGYKAQLTTAQTELEKLRESNSKANSKIHELLVDTAITTEFVKLKGIETAVPDVVSRAKQVWNIEDGVPIPRDANKEIMQGKNGIMTMTEWIESLRSSASHLFPESTSAGANGNNGQQVSGIDAKISAARKAGQLDEVRRLKALKEKSNKKDSA